MGQWVLGIIADHSRIGKEDLSPFTVILTPRGITVELLDSNLVNCEREVYNSFEEIIAAGWEVD